MNQEFRLPDLGEGIHEGEVTKVLVKVGEKVEEGNPIVEVETDKARVEIPSPITGTVTAVNATVGDMVKVGAVVMVFGDVTGAAPAPAPEPPKPARAREQAPEPPKAAPPPPPHPEGAETPVPASPATRRLARELGVDLHKVKGTGPGGLVSAEDVKAFKGEGEAAPPAPEPGKPAPAPASEPQKAAPAAPGALPDFSKWGPVERVPLRSIRRATARQMTTSWSRVPHVTHQDSVDITDMEAFRQRNKDAVSAQGGKLTLTAITMKAVAAALRAFPRFNASIDTERDEIILKRYYNIGVAVDAPSGLLVPVVRNVDTLTLTELSARLSELADRTREGKATLDDMRGGTFTVTNVGAIGGTSFTPLINYPEVAILGLGRAQMTPVVRDGEIVPRLVLPLSLAFDHRVVDGAEAARFVSDITAMLADPEALLLRT